MILELKKVEIILALTLKNIAFNGNLPVGKLKAIQKVINVEKACLLKVGFPHGLCQYIF